MPAGAFVPPTYNGMVVVDKQLVPLVNVAGESWVTLPPSQGGQAFLVERIQIESTATPTTCSIAVGTNEVDFSNSPAHDVADETQPIYVPPGAVLSITWGGGTNMNAGSYTAVVQYSVVQFVNVAMPGQG